MFGKYNKVGPRVYGGVPFVGILDTYPNAAVAYSVRKLRTDYTGNSIRVRRSSDNTEQDIGFTSAGNLDTTALTTFVGANDGFVTRWYDQSGNAKNATQTTAANQPKIVSSGNVITENGKPFIEYITNGTSQLKTTSTFSISTPLQTFIVGKNTRSVNDFPYYHDFSILRAVMYYGTNLALFNGLQIDSNDTSTTLNLISGLFNSTNSALYKNGNTLVTGNAGNSGASGTLFLGTRNNDAQIMYGGFQEFILYPSNQSSNRTGIETNINTYYGIY
jgi:hypothetical protein